MLNPTGSWTPSGEMEWPLVKLKMSDTKQPQTFKFCGKLVTPDIFKGTILIRNGKKGSFSMVKCTYDPIRVGVSGFEPQTNRTHNVHDKISLFV